MERSEIIKRMIKLNNEIDQIFIDAKYWNDNVRKPGIEAIDPDPDGQLKRLRARR